MKWANISTKQINRFIAMVVAFAMVFTMGFGTPLAIAENGGTESIITNIASLSDDVAVQHLPVGASESDVIFPSTIDATLETYKDVLVEVIPEEKLQEIEEVSEEIEETEEEIEEAIEEETEVPSDAANPEAEIDTDVTEADTVVEEATTEDSIAEDNTAVGTAIESTETPVENPEAQSVEAVSEPAAVESAPVVESAPEPASEPEPVDPVALIIDTLFPAITARAAEAGVFAEVSSVTAEVISGETEAETVVAEPTYVVETITTSTDITLTDITWTIDPALSTAPAFDSNIEGATYVYTSNIPTEYVINSTLPTITVIIGEATEEDIEFEQSTVVDGVVITVKADKGVFPEGATLSARRATAEETVVAEEAVENERESENVAASYTFDIKVLDALGNEIQPDNTKGTVKVSFTLEEVKNTALEADVYHITDANPQAPVAEKLETESVNATVEAETTGFSFYTVEFTYNGLQYVMDGDTYVLLSEILDYLGISGNVVSAVSSNEELFYARKYVYEEENQATGAGGLKESEDGQWYIVAVNPFSTDETLIVTMDDGNEYTIAVTDSQEEVGAHSYTNDNGDVFLGGNYIEVGVAKTGSFGTAGASDETFHPTVGHKSDKRIGLSVNGNGFASGQAATTGDFFLPGSPEERYILAYYYDGQQVNNCNAERNDASWDKPQQAPTTVDKSDVSEGKLKSVTTGVTREGVKMTMTISFDKNDLCYITEVLIENNTGKDIENVRWVRSFDPDQDLEISGTFNTYNKVISNPRSDEAYTADQCAMVVSKGAITKEAFFFAAFDSRARASRGVSFSPYSAYLDGLWVASNKSVPKVPTSDAYGTSKTDTTGYTYEDDAIAITFDCGTLKAGESTTLSYYSSLDPDVANTFSKISTVKGGVNYLNNSIEGLDKNTRYKITVDTEEETEVAYIITSDENGRIKLEDENNPEEAGGPYSFIGKSLHITMADEESDTLDVTVMDRPEATGLDITGTLDTDTTNKPSGLGKDFVITTADSITLHVDSDDTAKMLQNYRIYDEDGNEIDGREWLELDNTGKVVFEDLEGNTGYIIKTMVPATKNTPASDPIDGISVTTMDTVEVANIHNIVKDYDGRSLVCTPNINPADATVTYSIDYDSEYSNNALAMVKDVGTYTVYYKASKPGYRTTYGSFTVEINKANRYDNNQGTFDEKLMLIPEKCEDAVVSLEKYLADLSEDDVVTLVTEGDDENNIAVNTGMTGTITDKILTYSYPGSEEGTAGDLVLRVDSANYNPYTIIIPVEAKDVIQIDLPENNETTAEYDGKPHSYPLTTDDKFAVVKYSTTPDGELSTTAPSFTEPGEYTVYYSIERPGISPKTGSYTVKIEKPVEPVQQDNTETKRNYPPVASILKVEEPVEEANEEKTESYKPDDSIVKELIPELTETEEATTDIEDTLGKGKIIDKGDIWGDMTEETKSKLLEKLEASGGEIIKTANLLDPITTAKAELKAEEQEGELAEDRVPVKETPIALVMGEGAVVVTLELSDNTKANAGLADAKAVAKSILTEEQYAAVAAGSILEIKVELTPLEETAIPELDRQVIDDGVTEYTEQIPNLAMADYIDISMFMRIDDSDWNQLTEVDPIDIVIDIPETHKGLSDTYYIMRAHEGVSTLLEDKDNDSDTITISTGQFSTYALMYDEPQVAVKADFTSTATATACKLCHKCPTLFGICYYVWLAMVAAAGISLVLYKSARKQEEE